MTSTKRWELSSVSGRGKNGEHIVKISFGLCEEPIVLRVSQSKAREGERAENNSSEDVSAENRTEIPSYELVDKRRAPEWLKAYFERHSLKPRALELALRNSHPLIQETYQQAYLHSQRLAASAPAHKKVHQTLMKNLFKFWFAMRTCLDRFKSWDIYSIVCLGVQMLTL